MGVRETAPGRSVQAVAASVALVTCASLPQFLFGALSPLLVRDLDVSIASIGVALLALNAVAVGLSPFSGRMVDRVGVVVSSVLCLMVVAAGLVVLTLGTRAGCPLWVPAAMLGVSASLSQPVTNVVLMAALRPSRRGLGFGMKQAATPLAGLLAGASLPVAAELVGWRVVVAAFAVLALALAVFVGRAFGGGARESGGTPTGPARSTRLGALDLRLAGVVMATTCASAAYMASYTFFALVAVDRGLSLSASGSALVAGSLAAAVARVLLGLAADRFAMDLFRATGVVMLLGAIAMAAVVGVPAGALGIALACLGATAWAWNGLLHLAVTSAYERSPASATGVLQVGILGGAGLGPLVFTWLGSLASLSVAWTLMSVVLAGAAAAFLVIARPMANEVDRASLME